MIGRPLTSWDIRRLQPVKISFFFVEQKFHHGFHKTLPMDPIMNHLNSVYNFTLYLFKIKLLLSACLRGIGVLQVASYNIFITIFNSDWTKKKGYLFSCCTFSEFFKCILLNIRRSKNISIKVTGHNEIYTHILFNVQICFCTMKWFQKFEEFYLSSL
jgi:hypothetical protein